MKRAELHNIYVWDCDNCGVENRVSFKKAAPDAGHMDRLAEEAGVDPEYLKEVAVPDVYEMPEVVTCISCKSRYKAFVGSFGVE